MASGKAFSTDTTGKSYHDGKIPIVHYPYVKITLWNGDSFTQNPSDGRPDYFISLEHKRYVSQANQMSINITFVPKGSGDIGDPNRLERSMRDSGGLFRVQYGTTQKGGLKSPEYIGMIYNYSMSIQEGSLSYSISAVSRAVIGNYDNLKDNKLSINCQSDTDTTAVTDSPSSVLDKMEKVVNSTNLKEFCVFDKANSDTSFNVTKTVTAAGKVPMLFLMEVAATLTDKTNKYDNFYKIVVSDVDDGTTNKSKIRLVRTSSKKVGNYVFQWGGKNTDVISWRPEYQGAYAIFNNAGNNNFKNTVKTVTKDIGGNPTAAEIQTVDIGAWSSQAAVELANSASVSLSESATLSLTEVSKFKEDVQYPYKATLTVLGIGGDELSLGQSLVKVVPVINNQTHFSAGEYTVIGVTDKVDSGGFTTTLDLYRYVKTESAPKSISYNSEEAYKRRQTNQGVVTPSGSKEVQKSSPTNSVGSTSYQAGSGVNPDGSVTAHFQQADSNLDPLVNDPFSSNF